MTTHENQLQRIKITFSQIMQENQGPLPSHFPRTKWVHEQQLYRTDDACTTWERATSSMISGRPILIHFMTYIAYSYCYAIVMPTAVNYSQIEFRSADLCMHKQKAYTWESKLVEPKSEGEEVEGALVLMPELPLGTPAAPPLVAGLRRFLSSRARRQTRRGGAAVVRCVLGGLAVAWRTWRRTWTWTNEEWTLVMRYSKCKQFRITPRHSVDGTARNFWNFSCSSCQTKYQSSNLQIKLNYDGLLQVRLAYSSLSCTECF